MNLKSEREYILATYIGNAAGLKKQIKEWYWKRQVDKMTEGEVLSTYYELTKRKEMKANKCYLCDWAYQIIEHEEDPNRKYWIKCRLDDSEHEPCDYCDRFQEMLMEGRNEDAGYTD